MSRTGALLLLTVASMVGFSAARMTEEDASPEALRSEWLGTAGTELVVVVNPFNCHLSANDVRRLNGWHASALVRVRLHFVGVGATDLGTTRAVVDDLGIEASVTRASSDTPPEAWTGRSGIPTVALKRNGSVVLLIGNIPVGSALDVVEGALDAQY